LSDLDFSQSKPAKFEFEAKAARLNMRLPMALLDAVKARAKMRGVPCTRYIREVLEQAAATLTSSSRSALKKKRSREPLPIVGASQLRSQRGRTGRSRRCDCAI
jgi:hypothetical protein